MGVGGGITFNLIALNWASEEAAAASSLLHHTVWVGGVEREDRAEQTSISVDEDGRPGVS